MFHEKNKGKITIQIENNEGVVDSKMQRSGIAKKPETAITTLLVNFVSLSMEHNKNPKQVFEKHIDGIIELISKN